MRYEQVKAPKAEEFKRLCGVKSETFERMVAIVRLYNQNKQKPGRPGKICLEDQVLMTLDYWSGAGDAPPPENIEPISTSVNKKGVAESTACRIIRRVENILSQSRMFTLPGKKQLLESDLKIDAIVIDVTETPIERPKKNKNNFIVGRRIDYH